MPEDLVEALKRKEPAAFEWLMARHGWLLHRVAWRLMGQQEEAEEVLQETFLKVYEKIHTFDGGAALTTCSTASWSIWRSCAYGPSAGCPWRG
jgi:RNA polymerase sigma-70 factor (ECF subfamily)